MNDSTIRINKSVKNILNGKNEPAFDGTVKQGFKRKFTILNENDIKKYLNETEKNILNYTLDTIANKIEKRKS